MRQILDTLCTTGHRTYFLVHCHDYKLSPIRTIFLVYFKSHDISGFSGDLLSFIKGISLFTMCVWGEGSKPMGKTVTIDLKD